MSVSPPMAVLRHRDEIIAEIRSLLGEQNLPLYAMMRYHLGFTENGEKLSSPGKYVRAALCLAACAALGGDYRTALPAAAGVELLHNFALIHDDIEDGSDSRRQRETVWRVWGEAQAINAGDGMFATARLAVHRLRDSGVSSDVVLHVMQLFDRASLELAEGQYLDIEYQGREAVSRDEYARMAVRKTGAVMGAAAGAGAMVAEAPPPAVAAFERFGRQLGVAYQIRDDYLGIWGDPAETGKSVEDDLRSRKKSFPIVVALTETNGPTSELLRALLHEPGLSRGEIRQVVDLLSQGGVREIVQAAAEAATESAVAELRPLNLAGVPVDELSGIAAFVVSRDA